MIHTLFKCPDDNEKIATILKNMDYSPLLSPLGTEEKIKEICDHAKKFKIGRIVALQRYHKSVFQQLEGSDVKVVLGLSDVCTLEENCEYVRIGMEQGCNEVDMMMKLSLFFDGKYDAVQNEISQISSIARKYGRIIKVIIETGFLTDEQKILTAKLGLEAGATFIKTNLGMRPGRATIHDVLLLKEAFGDKIKVKASGSVASLEDAWAFIQAGAERLAMREVLVDQLNALNYKPV